MSKFIGNLLISVINFYRNTLGIISLRCCRFYPSCSLYAIESINKYGPLKGSIKAFWRILRCNPLSKGGYDPV